MKKKSIVLTIIAVSLLLSGCSCGKKHEYDKVIYGTIFVGEDSDKTVEAIVIKDGIIEYAGDKAGAKAYEEKAEEIVTLGDDEFIIPGITDGHSHPAVAWDNKINALMLEEGWNIDKYIEAITQYVKDNPDKTVYRVKGYMENEFKTDEQKNNPKALLDAISTDVPIVATDGGGHGLWCNTKAIEMFCEANPDIKMVDADKAGHDNTSIPGGTIERNSSGEAIGFFRDKAVGSVTNVCVKYTKDDYKECILKAQEEYASIGYTSYNESMINESSDVTQTPKVDAYNELEAEGKLTAYVSGSFIVGNRDDYLELVDQAIKLRDETAGGNFEVTDIKIFMDGVVEGGSAYLEEPYEKNADGTDAGSYTGSSSWANNLDRLTEVIVKANEAGMAVHFHSVGDQATKDALSCIEKAAEIIGADKVREARNVITHLQIVDDSDYEKFAEYNVIANLNPWASKLPGFYNEVEVLVLGEDRASNEYPYKTFLEKGIKCAFGTDYGSSFKYHFNEAYYTLTTRKHATVESPATDDSTQLNASECLTRAQALSVMTSGGAYQLKKEADFGTIEVGKKANLVVLNMNPLTAEESDLINIAAVRTMFEGNWVYIQQ